MHLYTICSIDVKQGGVGPFDALIFFLEQLEGVKGARSHSEWVLTHFQ